MQIDEFLSLVKNRRSCRSFKSDPVPEGNIEKILEAARWAMSGANAQPWEFIVVRDSSIRNEIINIYSSYQNEKWFMEQTRIEGLRHSNSQTTNKPENVSFRNAPIILVICGDPRTLQTSVVAGPYLICDGGFDAIYHKNLANATQLIHLAVAALGLGSEWLSVSYMIENQLKTLLEVPPQLRISTMVAIGYPAHPPAAPYRRELKEIVHFDKYDRLKYRTGQEVIDFIRDLRGRMKPVFQNRDK